MKNSDSKRGMNKDPQKIKRAKAFQVCKEKAVKSINNCFYPDCNNVSINSHILQKNGILSSLEKDRHLMQMEINQYRDDIHFFKRIGINEAFSFNCFCQEHDSELFKAIETKEIDFTVYKNLLLFTLRAIYNEKFRKIVNLKMKECLIREHHDIYSSYKLNADNEQEKLGILDIQKTEDLIWRDIQNGTESFVFKVRQIEKIELCLASFYNYETTQELNDYRIKYGKDMENVTDIFITVFPYFDKSVFIMGYKKEEESTVKGYVNSFFSENEKRLLRKLTNLLLFQCETWVTSEHFYNNRLKKCESVFSEAVAFSEQNMIERRFFDLNLFHDNFYNKVIQWRKDVGLEKQRTDN